MNNQDMPAHPQSGSSTGRTTYLSSDLGGVGETKREKAFWQVYSAMVGGIYSDYNNVSVGAEALAAEAAGVVDVGFKALGEDEV